jgi:hypothetical protein
MPVFTETANSQRDLRVLPLRAQPLSRLNDEATGSEENFEVIVIGVGAPKEVNDYTS